ncbi:MAG: hypothetical protein ABIO46_06115 [Chitinophagales bacterium]
MFHLFIALLASCNSVKHSYRSGDFGKAVERSVKKLSSNPNDEETIAYLEASYSKLYRQSMERITFLRKEDRPENVLPVYDELSALSMYGDLIKPLLPLNMHSKGRVASFNFLKDEDLIAAKQNAAAYLYAYANQLININDRIKARQAYELYNQLKCIYPDYKDVGDRLKEAQLMGTNQVFLKMENNSNAFLFQELEKQITSMPLYDLNADWVNFYGPSGNARMADYNVVVNIRQIIVTPDLQATPNIRTETKSIQDGWNYALDTKGNVKKDSLGNDIKTPKYKTIKCVVTEYLQQKTALIGGTIDYYNARNNSMMYSTPFSSNKVFQHAWATANGDLTALTKESAAAIKIGPAPYPSEIDMLLQGGEDLKLQVKNVIRDKMYLVSN